MSIHTFPLAWRWTDPRHALLPPEALVRINALDAAAATSVRNRWLPCFDSRGEAIPGRFARIEKRRTDRIWNGDVDQGESALIVEVGAWLRDCEPDLAVPVTVSWSHDLAVRTTWEVFTQWWNDFCYPSSDDALVVPEKWPWLLAFHHEEWFSFCYGPVS